MCVCVFRNLYTRQTLELGERKWICGIKRVSETKDVSGTRRITLVRERNGHAEVGQEKH